MASGGTQLAAPNGGDFMQPQQQPQPQNRGHFPPRGKQQHFEPPHFVQPLESGVHVMEGEHASFSTSVVPYNDPSLTVEWFKDGAPLNAGSRINPSYERGQATLDILHALAEDQGEYFCVAKSQSGTDQTAPAYLQVTSEAGVIHDSNYSRDDYATQFSGRPMSRGDLDPSGGCPPSFLMPLEPPHTTVAENDSVHWETKVEPARDPNLTVEWFKDGRPVTMGSRFCAMYERGYASLDLLYAYPEDSGVYFCVAKNNNGQVHSNSVELTCIGESAIITRTTLPQEAVDYLSNIDAPGDVNAKYDDFRYREYMAPISGPVFDVLPENQVAAHNGPAKFLVKVTAQPRPRVLWFLNDNLISSTSSYRIYHDGSINYLEFYRCRDVGVHKIRVLAKNKVGEATAEAELEVVPAEDYRPELRHVPPENNFKRLLALRKVEPTPELNDAFRKPKAHVTQMRKVERDSELRARANKPEVTEAENLYMSMQTSLRRSDSTAGAAAELNQAKLKQQFEKQLHQEYVQKLQSVEQQATQPQQEVQSTTTTGMASQPGQKLGYSSQQAQQRPPPKQMGVPPQQFQQQPQSFGQGPQQQQFQQQPQTFGQAPQQFQQQPQSFGQAPQQFQQQPQSFGQGPQQQQFQQQPQTFGQGPPPQQFQQQPQTFGQGPPPQQFQQQPQTFGQGPPPQQFQQQPQTFGQGPPPQQFQQQPQTFGQGPPPQQFQQQPQTFGQGPPPQQFQQQPQTFGQGPPPQQFQQQPQTFGQGPPPQQFQQQPQLVPQAQGPRPVAQPTQPAAPLSFGQQFRPTAKPQPQQMVQQQFYQQPPGQGNF